MPVMTVAIYADSIRAAKCQGRNCYRPIFFAQVVKTGKQMCFDVEPVPLEVQGAMLPGAREIWTVDLATTHWASCPDSKDFKRGTR